MAGSVERGNRGKISADFGLIIGLLAIGLLLGGGYVMQYGGFRSIIWDSNKTGEGKASGAPVVQVSVNGTVLRRYSLGDTVDEVLCGVNGGCNHLRIEQGMVWVEDASCPDQICVHTGKISEEGKAIICLPNRVVVEIIKDP